MSNLYELSNKYQALLDKDELDHADMADLEACHDNVEDAIIDRAKYIRNVEADQEAVFQAITEMTVRLGQLAKKAEGHRFALLEMMTKCKLDKVTKSPLFTIKIKKNPPSVMVNEELAIPKAYWREHQPAISIKLDKKLVKADIMEGKIVPGCQLVSQLKIVFK